MSNWYSALELISSPTHWELLVGQWMPIEISWETNKSNDILTLLLCSFMFYICGFLWIKDKKHHAGYQVKSYTSSLELPYKCCNKEETIVNDAYT